MNDLRTFSALQARVFEFLEQQDETTLRAIIDGTVKLAVAGADDAPAPAPREAARPAPARDPRQAAHDLANMAPGDRRIYLNSLKFGSAELKQVAKFSGLTGYSKLRVTELKDLLSGTEPDQVTDSSEPLPAEPPPSNAEMAAVAARLREIDTEDEGAAYLAEQRLDRDSLLAVAAELQMTRVDKLSQKELRKRVLKQAIGARRKFAGLRKW